MATAYIRDLCAKLGGLVSEMDDLESGFDRRVELSRMSGKRFRLLLDGRSPVVLSSPRLALLARHGGWVSRCRGCITLTFLAFHDPAEQGPKEPVNYLPDAEGETANRGSSLDEECRALKAEVAHLKGQIRNVRDEHERAERLERELKQAYAQIERDAATRLTLEDRYNNLLSTVQGLREGLDDAIAGLTGGARSPDNSRQEAVRTDDRENTAKEILKNQGKLLRNSEGAHALDVGSPIGIGFRGNTKCAPGDGQKNGRILPLGHIDYW